MGEDRCDSSNKDVKQKLLNSENEWIADKAKQRVPNKPSEKQNNNLLRIDRLLYAVSAEEIANSGPFFFCGPFTRYFIRKVE